MQAKETLPKNPVGVNAQECFTKSDEARNVQQRIWCELMQLYVVHKEKPAKEFMGRKR
jgi:hypothetical protein